MRKLFLITIIYACHFVSAQTLQLPKSILSPNASSLGKYGDVPMDLSTGRANVNIPLYSLNDDEISLDVSLNYDTGGVRVNDVPGWVGQNWTLNGGGVITRTVKGTTYDELIFDINKYPESQRGYYYQTHKLNTSSWNSPSYLRQLAINASGGNGGNTDNYMHDLEPDVFTFNFMGYSGKFFLGEDKTWKVSSNSNLKVTIDMNDNIIPMNFPVLGYQPGIPDPLKFPKTIGKITITDDKGNTFIFGGTMNNIEFTNFDFFRQSNTLLFATSWYLKDVYNNLGQKIYSLEYERGNYQASFYNWNIYSDYKKPTDGSFWTPGGGCSYSYTPQIVYAGGQLIIPTYLKTINGIKSNTTVTFNSNERISSAYKNTQIESPISRTYEKWLESFGGNYGFDFTQNVQANYYYLTRAQDGITYNYEGGDPYSHINNFLKKLKWRKLNTIIIDAPNINKTITLNYTDNENQRLQLNSVLYDGKKHTLEYNNTASLPQSYLSKSVDHFGYYKGSDFDMNPSNHYASREININTLKYGSLTKIIYPLGGFTTFEYEPHTYSRSVDGNSNLVGDVGTVSGLRVKKTIDFSDPQNKIEKEYLYSTDINSQSSSGILVQKNQYYFPNWSIKTTSGVTYHSNIFSINSIVPMGNFSGSQIEYPIVIEKTLNNGFIKYEFTNYEDYNNLQYSGTISPEHSIFDPKTEFGYKRGKLRFKKYYSQANIKLREEEYNYGEINTQKVRAYAYENYVPCYPVMDGVLTGNAYEIFYSDFNLISKTVKSYNVNGDFIQDFESYNYINRENFGDTFLRNKNRNTINGILKDDYKYTFDKNGIEPYTTLTNRREYAITNTDTTLDFKKLSSSMIDYGVFTINTGVTQIFPQKFSESLGTNTLEEKLIYDRYDSKGNLLQYTTKNGISTTTIWDYNQTMPIAKIEGATYPNTANPKPTDVSQALIDNIINASNYLDVTYTESNLVSTLDTFRKDNTLKNYQITTYTYKPLIGVSTITPPNGIREIYEYDAVHRLKYVKDVDGNILKDYQYNYAPLKYYNSAKSQPFTRNNCGNSIGGSYIYTVPEYKYWSYINKDAAEQQAQDEINANGQNIANVNGTCTPINCPLSIYISGGGSVSVLNQNYRVQLGFSSGVGRPWTTTGVVIAKINGTCIPQTEKTINSYSGGYIWEILIKTNGELHVKKLEGLGSTGVPNNTSYNLDFTFPIN